MSTAVNLVSTHEPVLWRRPTGACSLMFAGAGAASSGGLEDDEVDDDGGREPRRLRSLRKLPLPFEGSLEGSLKLEEDALVELPCSSSAS